MPEVTLHAKQRIRERVGANERSAERLAEKALAQGITHKETTGRLHKWIDKQYLSCGGKPSTYRVYGEFLYIFTGEVLITVIPIPNNLKKQVREICKKVSKKTCKESKDAKDVL